MPTYQSFIKIIQVFLYHSSLLTPNFTDFFLWWEHMIIFVVFPDVLVCFLSHSGADFKVGLPFCSGDNEAHYGNILLSLVLYID